MISDELKQVATKAKALYKNRYRDSLEATHRGEYICIEPDSQEYFLGATFDDAVNKAIDAYPDRKTYTLRVGYEAALHLGVVIQ